MDIKNNDSPKAYYPEESYDQSGYMKEKSGMIIYYLCQLIDAGQPENDDLKTYIAYAISDAFKLYTFWIGKKELYTDNNLAFILSNGSEGFKHFKFTNDLSYDIDKFSKNEYDKMLESEILNLIIYEQNNRTIIHEKIQRFFHRSEFINNLENDIEKVTMGEETWEWFVGRYKADTKKNDDKQE